MKELHEIAMKAERAAEVREMEQKARAETFQAKVAEQVPKVVIHYYFHWTYQIRVYRYNYCQTFAILGTEKRYGGTKSCRNGEQSEGVRRHITQLTRAFWQTCGYGTATLLRIRTVQRFLILIISLSLYDNIVFITWHLSFTENEPSDRETEIWKELQATRLALSRAEEELKQSRADKDSFLNTLSRIAVKLKS